MSGKAALLCLLALLAIAASQASAKSIDVTTGKSAGAFCTLTGLLSSKLPEYWQSMEGHWRSDQLVCSNAVRLCTHRYCFTLQYAGVPRRLLSGSVSVEVVSIIQCCACCQTEVLYTRQICYIRYAEASRP
jgi:hypothetical protein